MALKEELEGSVGKILAEQWSERDGRAVPDPQDLGLGNDAMKLDATVLYADMSGSTKLVDAFTSPKFPAEVYKCYLSCAAKIIKAGGGSITAYDGDRVMGVFLGDSKNSDAAKVGLQINYAVAKIINPRIESQYTNISYKLRHVVGIDTSPLFAARIGVRNDNDLVWVGRAANYAAKLTDISEDNTVFITNEVFTKLHDLSKFGGVNKELMWKARQWSQMGNMSIHSSTWTWTP